MSTEKFREITEEQQNERETHCVAPAHAVHGGQNGPRCGGLRSRIVTRLVTAITYQIRKTRSSTSNTYNDTIIPFHITKAWG